MVLLAFQQGLLGMPRMLTQDLYWWQTNVSVAKYHFVILVNKYSDYLGYIGMRVPHIRWIIKKNLSLVL